MVRRAKRWLGPARRRDPGQERQSLWRGYLGGSRLWRHRLRDHPAGREKVLYAFTDGDDGGAPETGVIRDEKGNLYGTTELFGRYYYGTIFKLAPDGTETTLYSFTGGNEASFPTA